MDIKYEKHNRSYRNFLAETIKDLKATIAREERAQVTKGLTPNMTAAELLDFKQRLAKLEAT